MANETEEKTSYRLQNGTLVQQRYMQSQYPQAWDVIDQRRTDESGRYVYVGFFWTKGAALRAAMGLTGKAA